MKIESVVEIFLIYCIQFLKMDFILRLFFQQLNELAQEVLEVLLPYGPHGYLEQVHMSALKADLT